MTTPCPHTKRASLYRRASRKEGAGFKPDAERCLACRALLERQGKR